MPSRRPLTWPARPRRTMLRDMSTPAAAPVTLPTPAPITSAQPGGGLCMHIELAWGRLRRSWLRRRHPDYVQAMAAKRQGTCPNCSHDIIDARDLKFFRNVCGYSFKDEDDPYRWRGQLGLARMGLAEIICFSLALTAAALFLVVLTAAVAE